MVVGKILILLVTLTFLSCSDREKGVDHHQEKEQVEAFQKSILATKKAYDFDIYSDYNEAYALAKAKNKSVFILFTTEYCRWCVKLKEITLKDPELGRRLQEEFVVLFLDRDRSTYPTKYKVRGVPAVYLTDKNEELFTSMVGYHKNPEDYIKWFDYIKIETSEL